MEKAVRVVLVESSYLISAGLEKLIAELSGLVLIEIYDGTEKQLLEKIRDNRPDLLIINPEKPIKDLQKLLHSIEIQNTIKIVCLINSLTPENVKSHFKYFLDVENDKYELLNELKQIVGQVKKTIEFTENEEMMLSEREKIILRQVAMGLTSIEIAEKLFLSIHTINTHRKNISKKLGIKTVSGLTVFALMNQIVNIHEIENK